MGPTFCPLAAARTTGNQSIFRSELYAIVKVCEWFESACIITDSAAAIRTFHRCQRARDIRELGDLSERDLVLRLWAALQRGHHTIAKVKSHVQPGEVSDLLQRYRTMGNIAADTLANNTCQRLYGDYVQAACALHRDLAQEQEALTQLFTLQLALQKERATLQAALDRQLLAEVAWGPSLEFNLHKLTTWTILDPWALPPVRCDRTHVNAWGPTWAATFRAWASQLRWPRLLQRDDSDPGVTFQELALSLCCFAGQVLPVRRWDSSGDTYLIQVASLEQCHSYDVYLSDLADNFAVFARQMDNLCDRPFFPAMSKGKCRSIYMLGARVQSCGYLLRPQMPCQEEFMPLLATMAQQHGPDLPGCVPDLAIWDDSVERRLAGKVPQIQSELRDSWLVKRARAQRVSNEMRAMKRTAAPAQRTLRDMFGG
eukprot:Skav205534  [mRNA]  locus=scaffold4253:371583:372866:+ [translate_table: standard]